MALALVIAGLTGTSVASGRSLSVLTLVANDPLAGGGTLSGPVLAGADVIWAQGTSHGLLLRGVDAAGTVRDLQTIPLPRAADELSLDVSGASDRVALSFSALKSQDRNDPEILARAVLQGPASGPLVSVQGPCGALGCFRAPCSGSYNASPVFAAPALVATDAEGPDGCEATVLGTAPDGRPIEDQHPGHVIDLNGRFLAFVPPSNATTEVSDVFRGKTVLQAPLTFPGDAALDDDGTLLFGQRGVGGGHLFYISPGDSTVHPLPGPAPGADYDERLQIAAGGGHFSLAYPLSASSTGTASGAERIIVVDRAGGVLHQTTTPNLVGSLRLDATRLTWATRACAVNDIMVWDLSQAPPVAPMRCGRARPAARGYAYADSYGGETLVLPLRCPALPVQGCAGSFAVRHGHRFLAHGRFAVTAGAEGAIDTGVSSYARSSTIVLRSDGHPPLTRRISVRNLGDQGCGDATPLSTCLRKLRHSPVRIKHKHRR